MLLQQGGTPFHTQRKTTMSGAPSNPFPGSSASALCLITHIRHNSIAPPVGFCYVLPSVVRMLSLWKLKQTSTHSIPPKFNLTNDFLTEHRSGFF